MKGGLYCKIHDEEDDDACEVCTGSVECEITAHRQVDGDLEYRIVQRDDEAEVPAKWVRADDVAASVVRAYETARLPPSGAQKKEKKWSVALPHFPSLSYMKERCI